MSDHALLGPSGAHRWLVCPPSARLEEGTEDKGSSYAQEGTVAHRLGELLLREEWEGLDISAALADVKDDPLYSAAMLEHIEGYVAFVAERMAEAKTRCPDPRIFIEQRLDYSEYVTEGFGTADCAIVADGQLDVIDLKYGAGQAVRAEGNPQMMLYGLGCLLALGWAYEITEVRMNIFQPRMGGVDCAVIPVPALLDWAKKELRPAAAKAWEGGGDFCPGDEQCKWCRVGATCRARAEYQLELAKYEFSPPDTMDSADIAEVLERLSGLQSWAKLVGEYALDQAANHGVSFPRFKLVEGSSRRKYTDEGKIAKALKAAGYKVTDIFKPKALLGLTDMEKLVGRKRFHEIAGAHIEKPPGAPTLVPESDKRPALNTAAKAAEDFAEVG